MSGKKPKRKLIKKLRHKYRLIIYNDNTFEEIWSFRLSRLNVLAGFSLLSFVLIILTTIIIAFTPLREYIPGYPRAEYRKLLLRNSIRLDSLEREMDMRSQFLDNIETIVKGEEPKDYQSKSDSTKRITNVKITRSKEDSAFRAQVEEEEKFNISKTAGGANAFSNIHFFPPIKGMVSNQFNEYQNHLGTDIVAEPGNVICSTLDGTVILSTWTMQTGYTIQIQHSNNILSVYKHVVDVFVKEGKKVKAGEAIAVFGNSGELSSGPHLHFELWHNGKPINPESVIAF